MSEEEFCTLLKKIPLMMAEDIEKLIMRIATDPPEMINRDRDGALNRALAYRLSDVKTGPASRAYVDLIMGIGAISAMQANRTKSVG